MVTVLNCKSLDGSRKIYEFAGLSTDEKPTEGQINASTFYEIDTGDVYAFDEDSKAWFLQI